MGAEEEMAVDLREWGVGNGKASTRRRWGRQAINGQNEIK